MVDNNLVFKEYLFLNGLLSILNNKAFIRSVDTLTSQIIDPSVACL